MTNEKPTTNRPPTNGKRSRSKPLGKLVTLTVGDWAADGHGRTHRVTIRTNLSAPELQRAYAGGTKIVGFDLKEEVARDYEDNLFPNEYLSKLIELGLPVGDIFGDVPEEELVEYGLDYDTYWMVWLFIAKLGAPQLAYRQVLEGSNVNVGGYGLFFS